MDRDLRSGGAQQGRRRLSLGPGISQSAIAFRDDRKCGARYRQYPICMQIASTSPATDWWVVRLPLDPTRSRLTPRSAAGRAAWHEASGRARWLVAVVTGVSRRVQAAQDAESGGGHSIIGKASAGPGRWSLVAVGKASSKVPWPSLQCWQPP
ncbi:hypothetical protein P154DRAFT_576975 [Amniculicola lignicola CBS 123094]|uniref:Uncharacterized protein n=1 Tax=Amniculicola lignicola CBS 123094 TaxID=1392246 RepID=A0A6A5WF38_9PLEO|nr:hypothetical protein P154DRAFT_576975 [Amniculicola lignicola CBS 123094]